MKKIIEVTKLKFFLILFIVLFTMSILNISCNKNPNSRDFEYDKSEAVYKSLQDQNLQTSQNLQTVQNLPDKLKTDDYLVYTANIRGKVNSLENFESSIISIINKNSGYISSIEKFDEDKISITFKIPKNKFYDIINSIKTLFISVENESIQIEDISQQYIDLEARLNSKKEAEKRYLALLQKANSVKEILEIEQALRQIREEIESYEATLRYYKNSIQYSTITLNGYVQRLKVKGESFLTRFVKAISSGFNLFVNVLFFIISLWPIIIILIILIILIKKFKHKKKI
ncbi:MAG: DUF4349 domain-containing protein [Exilispira sp.]